MTILADTKLALRISNTAYDTEIADLILQAEADLALCGVLKIVETDALVKRAIVTYCKATFGLNNSDSDKMKMSYEMIRDHLALSKDYAYYKVTLTAHTQGAVIFDDETKQTNAVGVAVFYCVQKNHVQYTLNGIVAYTDVVADMTIGA